MSCFHDLKNIFNNIYMCRVCVCVCPLHVTSEEVRGMSDSPGVGVTGSWEVLDVNTGNQTKVLCKNHTCSNS